MFDLRPLKRDFSSQNDCVNNFLRFLNELGTNTHKVIKLELQIQWGWGITGQRITGQSCPDWLKIILNQTSQFGLTVN